MVFSVNDHHEGHEEHEEKQKIAAGREAFAQQVSE
jgi:hypothetical protein